MLQSIKKLYGDKLGASDGDLGHVKDFYFDDQNWVVRYLVADTGTWLPGRQVLISPHSLGGLSRHGKVLAVKLTRKQIEESPSIDSHKPISRQYEEEFYRFYGWDYYWDGDALWGKSGFPLLDLPPDNLSRGPTSPNRSQPERRDAHLRSTQAVGGYHLEASDGTTGHVADFLINTQSWAISHLVIKTGHRLSGKEVQILTSKVVRISYDQSTVVVDLTRNAVEESPVHELAAVGTA